MMITGDATHYAAKQFKSLDSRGSTEPISSKNNRNYLRGEMIRLEQLRTLFDEFKLHRLAVAPELAIGGKSTPPPMQ